MPLDIHKASNRFDLPTASARMRCGDSRGRGPVIDSPAIARRLLAASSPISAAFHSKP
ncbi:hypothetical protein [Kibdelosporangium phytohabitans]|uniref:hypothetical protein n=1 Tax=Kibdelosporangium phytohabitans TaxID=860235 RepID=UPI0012F91A8D|nr:hypothetical protein [Kibdelosporangium phytohabitans]MBE1467628.1 hypothetical protein [Kibdelosporangium phytohabitans]